MPSQNGSSCLSGTLVQHKLKLISLFESAVEIDFGQLS